MTQKDPVREYLIDSGCGEHVIEGGLPGLVENWESVAQSVEDGYSLGLDDYLNDLDARQILDEALEVATPEQRAEFADRIALADEKMKNSVEIIDHCLWGDEVAVEEGWTPEKNWWYFARPTNAGPEWQ